MNFFYFYIFDIKVEDQNHVDHSDDVIKIFTYELFNMNLS